MSIKTKLENLEKKAREKGIIRNHENAQDTAFRDYLTKVVNAKDEELTEGEIEVKEKIERFEKMLQNAKDNEEETQKVFKEIRKDDAFSEGYLEIFRKVKDGESFEAGRDKNARDKLNKEYRDTLAVYKRFQKCENKQEVLYKRK